MRSPIWIKKRFIDLGLDDHALFWGLALVAASLLMGIGALAAPGKWSDVFAGASLMTTLGALGFLSYALSHWKAVVVHTDEQVIHPPKDTLIDVFEPARVEGHFVMKTPEEIKEVFRSHNNRDALKLLEPYIGLQYGVQGFVDDLQIERGNMGLTLMRSPKEPSVFAHFHDKWVQRLAKLEKGSRVAIVGTIAKLDSLYIRLKECDLYQDGD